MSQVSISDLTVEDFARNGAICLRGVFSSEWLERLAVGVEKSLGGSMMTTATGSMLTSIAIL